MYMYLKPFYDNCFGNIFFHLWTSDTDLLAIMDEEKENHLESLQSRMWDTVLPADRKWRHIFMFT